MVKVLPDRVIATVALATELNALSQELDRVLLARLPRADGNFSVPSTARLTGAPAISRCAAARSS